MDPDEPSDTERKVRISYSRRPLKCGSCRWRCSERAQESVASQIPETSEGWLSLGQISTPGERATAYAA